MLILAETDKVLRKLSKRAKSNDVQLLSLLVTKVDDNAVKAADEGDNRVTEIRRQRPIEQIYDAPITRPDSVTSLTPAAPNNVIKITIIGEARCGKTSLVHRLTTGGFSRKYLPTYGAESTLLCFGNKNTQPCYFRFLDTNDVILDPSMTVTLEERTDALHARFSDYVIIVYDITDHKSFEAAKDWLRLTYGFLHKDARLILVGNKTDLAKRRQVHRTAGETLAALGGMDFLETSALTEQSVHKLFLYIGGLS